MAFFGAPLEKEDHASLACLCALDYQKRLKELQKVLKERNWPGLQARIGINSGIMIVGNMGSHKSFDYTVMGDNVNLGARLEVANKYFGTSIMISENTYRLAEEAIEAREFGLIRVKGKNEAIRVYEKYLVSPPEDSWDGVFIL